MGKATDYLDGNSGKKKVVGEDNMKKIMTRVRALYRDKEKKENKTLHIIRDSS
jgi:hypothetical protein